VVHVQYSGTGDFRRVWLSLAAPGELIFKKDTVDGQVLRAADVQGCSLAEPRKARKGHEHALRVDTARDDAKGDKKYILSVETVGELLKLRTALERYGTVRSAASPRGPAAALPPASAPALALALGPGLEPAPAPAAPLHTPRARERQGTGGRAVAAPGRAPDAASDPALAVPAPCGGWLPLEQEYEALLPRKYSAVHVTHAHQQVVWNQHVCNAVCSHFRLMVGPPPPGNGAPPPDRLDLPWMRIWKVDRREAVVTLLTKTGETHRLRAQHDSEELAQTMVDRLQQKLREARIRSQIGTDRPFGSRPGRLQPEEWQIADVPGPTDARELVMADYGRMGLHVRGAVGKFRKYTVEPGKTGPELKTYPDLIFVPATINRNQLHKSAEFRGNAGSGRLPAVVWRHPGTGVVIARSGQPRPGLIGERSAEDEALLRMIADAGRAPFNEEPGLTVFDARPKLNADANRIKGGGSEDCSSQGGYNEHSIVFLDIGNIHLMRKLLVKLAEELAALDSTAGSSDGFFGSTGSSGGAARAWVDCQAQVLNGAAQMRDCLMEGRSCLVHCTDGWDRTPQLSATAQILVDGYYRTIDGFVALVQREWLDFGHTFGHRMHGHDEDGGDHASGSGRERSASPEPGEHDDTDSSEWSPIFLQWIETIWQLLIQFPEAFEFTESLLMEVIDAAYSCEWTTFVGDSYRQRVRCLRQQQAQPAAAGGAVAAGPVEEEACFWHTRLLSDAGRRRHENSLYTRGGPTSAHIGRDRLLFPCVASCKLRLWDELHMSRHQPHLTPRMDVWRTDWIRSAPLTKSSRTRADQLPSVPGGGGDGGGEVEVGGDDYVSSPRTGGIADEEEEDEQTATLDTSQLYVTDAFYGGGEPEPEPAMTRSASIEFGQTVELPPMSLPTCLERCEWAPDSASSTCTACNVPWSAALRRHHCRLCGGLFCYSCAPDRDVAGTSLQTQADADAWAQQVSSGPVDELVAPGTPRGPGGGGAGHPGKLRCCESCSAVLELGGGGVNPSNPTELAGVLHQRWRSRLTMMQPVVTAMEGTPRRPRNLGGAGPWLVQVLRGCAWEDEHAQLVLEQLSEVRFSRAVTVPVCCGARVPPPVSPQPPCTRVLSLHDCVRPLTRSAVRTAVGIRRKWTSPLQQTQMRPPRQYKGKPRRESPRRYLARPSCRAQRSLLRWPQR
jgi:hypothetical protein